MAQDLTLDPAHVTAAEPVRGHDIRGGGGIRLHAHEWGNPDGPAILFVHGWSQCDMCWTGQVGGPLAERFRMVTFDNRGHGMSEKPLDSQCYTDERLSADDLAAVIEQTRLQRPVLVAWSYGGFIVADYVRAHGDAAIAGIDLADAAVLLRPPSFDHLGPGLLANAQDACVPDLRVNITAIRRFLRSCTALQQSTSIKSCNEGQHQMTARSAVPSRRHDHVHGQERDWSRRWFSLPAAPSSKRSSRSAAARCSF